MPPQRTTPSRPSKRQTQLQYDRKNNQSQASQPTNHFKPQPPSRLPTKIERFEAHQRRLEAYDRAIRKHMERNDGVDEPEKIGGLKAGMKIMIQGYYREEGDIERNEMRAKEEKLGKELKDQKEVQERGGKVLERRGDGGIEHLEQVIARVSGVAVRK